MQSLYGHINSVKDPEREKYMEVNDVVIPRDTKLPCSITKNYVVLADDQKIDCSVKRR